MRIHLTYDYLERHQVHAAYCGALIPKGDERWITTEPDEVTCANCCKPGVLKRHQIKQDESKNN